MTISGTHIHYYFLCPRKLWLFHHRIDMEHNSDLVAIGRLISDTSYQRADHEIRIDGISLDFYDEKTKTIHEIKKSDSMEDLHLWQVKWYISVLESKGISGVTGEIDYPKLRQKICVELSDDDRARLVEIAEDIRSIAAQEIPPDTINKPFCKNCSYYELCYA